MLMALGQFVFQLPTLAYSELQRSSEWRQSGNGRVGARPARQFVGQGDDTITLAGALVPEIAGSFASLDTLRSMADAGSAYAMVDGIGRVFGAWVITGLQESGSAFTQDGIARRTDFTLNLVRVDDEQVASASAADLPQPTLATIDSNGGGASGLA